jgi:hypothetical protein
LILLDAQSLTGNNSGASLQEAALHFGGRAMLRTNAALR